MGLQIICELLPHLLSKLHKEKLDEILKVMPSDLWHQIFKLNLLEKHEYVLLKYISKYHFLKKILSSRIKS
jgi:hypothetical protein